MSIDIVVPTLEEEKTTKDLVITILAAEWPLTLKKIYNAMKKMYAHSVTYQAVYKAVNLLLKQKVLIKEKKQYRINDEWVRQLKSFIAGVEKSYAKEKKIPSTYGIIHTQKEGEFSTFVFDNLFDLDKFWMKVCEEYVNNVRKEDENPPMIWQGNHTWWLLVYPDEEFEMNKNILKKGLELYFLIKNKTVLDEWCRNFYEETGIKARILDDKTTNSDMQIFGDYVMQVYPPKEIKEAIDAIFTNAKKLTDVDIPSFIEDILKKKIKIKLTIIKNRDVANQLRKEVLRHFN